MIETALIACLRRSPTVEALVEGRVFSEYRPEDGPQARLPAVVIQTVSDEPVRSTDGASGLTHRFYDVEFYAETVETIVELAEAMRLWCDDFRGRIKGVLIRDIRLSGLASIVGPVIGGRGLPTFGRSFDASVWFVERRPIR